MQNYFGRPGGEGTWTRKGTDGSELNHRQGEWISAVQGGRDRCVLAAHMHIPGHAPSAHGALRRVPGLPRQARVQRAAAARRARRHARKTFMNNWNYEISSVLPTVLSSL